MSEQWHWRGTRRQMQPKAMRLTEVNSRWKERRKPGLEEGEAKLKEKRRSVSKAIQTEHRAATRAANHRRRRKRRRQLFLERMEVRWARRRPVQRPPTKSSGPLPVMRAKRQRRPMGSRARRSGLRRCRIRSSWRLSMLEATGGQMVCRRHGRAVIRRPGTAKRPCRRL